MNILRAGSTAGDMVELIRNPSGTAETESVLLIVLSGACWWCGPRTCRPPPQNDYAVNWMFKQAAGEEFSRNMQHCCLAEKCPIQNSSCLFFSLNKCSDCMILLFNSSKACLVSGTVSFQKFQHTYLVKHTSVCITQRENWILLHIKRFSLCQL